MTQGASSLDSETVTNSTSPSCSARLPQPRSQAPARPAQPPPPPPPVNPQARKAGHHSPAPDPGQLPWRRHLAAYAARVSSWVAGTRSAQGSGRPTKAGHPIADTSQHTPQRSALWSQHGVSAPVGARCGLWGINAATGRVASPSGLCSALSVWDIQRTLEDGTIVPPARCKPPLPSHRQQRPHARPAQPPPHPPPVEPASPDTASRYPTQGQLPGRRHLAAYAARVSSWVAGPRSGLPGLSTPVAGPNMAAAGGRVRRARTLFVTPGHWESQGQLPVADTSQRTPQGSALGSPAQGQLSIHRHLATYAARVSSWVADKQCHTRSAHGDGTGSENKVERLSTNPGEPKISCPLLRWGRRSSCGQPRGRPPGPHRRARTYVKILGQNGHGSSFVA